MALTVEDGTGKAGADAFVSVADCAAYCAANGLTAWEDGDADTWEPAIRRATSWLSTAFTWKGYRTNGRSQALAWPRTDVEDAEGEAIPADEVPVEIVRACCEAAVYELANPGALSPTVTMTDRIRSEQVGSLRVEYQATPTTADSARPVLLKVRELVGGLVAAGSNPLVGRTLRG